MRRKTRASCGSNCQKTPKRLFRDVERVGELPEFDDLAIPPAQEIDELKADGPVAAPLQEAHVRQHCGAIAFDDDDFRPLAFELILRRDRDESLQHRNPSFPATGERE
jgi:hypothetical protein